MVLKNAVSTYPEGRKKANWPFSQFNSFADTAVLPCTAEIMHSQAGFVQAIFDKCLSRMPTYFDIFL